MTLRAWAISLSAAALAVGGLWLYTRYQESRVTQAVQESTVLKGKVDALQEQAGEHVAKADELAQTVTAQDKTILDLKAKLARVKNPSSKPAPSATESQPIVDPVEPTADQLKDQIIEAQDQQIGTLKGEVLELRTALTLKDQALMASEQRARGLEIALDAQRHAAKSGKGIGRVQGFAVGFAAGYLVGRF